METPPKAPVRIPAFHPVPTRGRQDGWTPLRQVIFIGSLSETRSVAEAARRVGMTRESAYRLRRRKGAEEFGAAWEVAQTPSGRREPRAFTLTESVLCGPVVGLLLNPLIRPLPKVTEAALWRHQRSRPKSRSI